MGIAAGVAIAVGLAVGEPGVAIGIGIGAGALNMGNSLAGTIGSTISADANLGGAQLSGGTINGGVPFPTYSASAAVAAPGADPYAAWGGWVLYNGYTQPGGNSG
jgi:hypothetical protein